MQGVKSLRIFLQITYAFSFMLTNVTYTNIFIVPKPTITEWITWNVGLECFQNTERDSWIELLYLEGICNKPALLVTNTEEFKMDVTTTMVFTMIHFCLSLLFFIDNPLIFIIYSFLFYMKNVTNEVFKLCAYLGIS